MINPLSLPKSCNNLPSDVISHLQNLHERINSIKWLDGQCDEDKCSGLMQEYFARINAIPSASRSLRPASEPSRAKLHYGPDEYRDCGSFSIKWVRSDWADAIEWTRHCYLRGNISGLHTAIEYMSSVAETNGRDTARHDCWELFGESAANLAPDQVRDGAWFTAGAMAAWTTIEDLADSPNPFAPMLGIWEEGFWPIGHVHSYQNEFVVFIPDRAPVEVFISYKWEDDERNRWVENLYFELRRHGIDAKLDRYEVPLGGSFTQYMSSKIEQCKRVLFVITPASVEAANKGKGGIGFETQLANSIRMSGDREAFIIPILREGSVSPNFLRDYRWIDFRDDTEYNDKLAELIDWLTGSIGPPPLGGTMER